MIAEKNTQLVIDNCSPLYFGEDMSDGRLTAEYDNMTYRFRDMLVKRNELGRPLTEEEMTQFKIEK